MCSLSFLVSNLHLIFFKRQLDHLNPSLFYFVLSLKLYLLTLLDTSIGPKKIEIKQWSQTTRSFYLVGKTSQPLSTIKCALREK